MSMDENRVRMRTEDDFQNGDIAQNKIIRELF